jgi:hypothetical protein
MKKILLIVVAALAPVLSFGQFSWGYNYFEVGGGVGVMNYSGELTNSIFDYKHLHLGGAIFARYNTGQYLSFRLQGAYGNISGNDADATEQRNKIRNLSYKSHVVEGAIQVEFNLMGYHPRGHQRMFSPYVFLGLNVFNYKPKSAHFDPNQDGAMVALQPLKTEGQGSSALSERSPYSLTQIGIPLGLGFKYAINSHMNIGFEVGFRKTFTDYLDDVGQTYPIDAVSEERLYDTNPYRAEAFGEKSLQELMADRTYEYVAAQRGQTLNEYLNTLSPAMAKEELLRNDDENAIVNEYESYVRARGGELVRGDKLTDWYVFSMLTISYNFIDNGLGRSGHRKRRRRKAGCKSAQF